jgi:hypothetical protein
MNTNVKSSSDKCDAFNDSKCSVYKFLPSFLSLSIYFFVFLLCEGIRTLGRTRHRREDNIRIDLRKIGWDVLDWSHLTQDRGQ